MMFLTSPLYKALGVLVISVLPVNLQTNDGETVTGELAGFTESAVRVDQNGRSVEYPFDDLLSLSPIELDEKTGPKYRVTLIGGSRIAAQDVSFADGTLVVQPRRQDPIEIPVKQVKSIRFRPSAVATDASWLGIMGRESRGDTLVIRRPGDRLDPQQGIVVSIKEDKVGFDLDGDVVNAPIDRLEGVVFGGGDSVVENAEVQVTDVWGSVWSLVSIDPSTGADPLRMRLTPAVVHSIPLRHIASIRWSGGVSMLAANEPASQSLRTYFKTNVDDQLTSRFFGPSREGETDLLMFGGSSIEYRIEPGYRILAGSIRRHEEVSNASKVNVRIELDGKPVWEQSLPDAEPRGFEIPLEQSRRVAIKIEHGTDGDLGDTVRISRPRLLK